VPAGGEQQGASRRGFEAVRCQLMGQYGASGQNWAGGTGRTASGLATTDKRAIARAFGTMTKPSKTVMLLTEAIPIRGTSPASRGLLRPRVQHRDADRERSVKLSDRAKC